MNEPENLTQDSSAAALKSQIAALNKQTFMLTVGLVVVSLMLTAFVGLQAVRSGRDADQIRPQAMQLKELNAKQTPVIQNFVTQLVAYGEGHPDYAEKVLLKFGIKPGTQPAAGQTGVGATRPIAPKK